MKIALASTILSLALALPVAAFAQNHAAPSQAQPSTTQTVQHEAPQSATTRGADTSGYGMQSGGTSASWSPAGLGHSASSSSNHGRGGIFAHH